MFRLDDLRQRTFASLANPNYRLFFGGQIVSRSGTWLQAVAQSWLVLQLTGSGTALGVLMGLQTVPVLVFGAYAGVVIDRISKRLLLICVQAIMGVQALVLGVVAATGTATLWLVYALALVLGLCNAFENPARQSFVLEMVGRDQVGNAVTLNTVTNNVARALGPALAGIIIDVFGTGPCFFVNGASFAVVIVTMLLMRVEDLRPAPRAARERGQLTEGLRYVGRTAQLRTPLVMLALVGCFAYEFQVVLPLMATDTFAGDASTYGFMTAAMGVGAIGGGLVAATRARTGLRPLVISTACFSLAMLAAALAPVLALELAALLFVGASSVTFSSMGSSTLQVTARPGMQGRVMALWAVAMLGSTPIGGPVDGAIAQLLGARWGLLAGAFACAVAVVVGVAALERRPGWLVVRLPRGRRNLDPVVAVATEQLVEAEKG